jgi:hypothetical protein
MALVHSPDSSVANWTRLIRLGEKAVAIDPTIPWLQHALAGAYLRAGQYEHALRSLDESDRIGEAWHARVLNDLMRAIVHLRLGDARKARQILVPVDQWYEHNLKPGPRRPFGEWAGTAWIDWLSFQFLRREADALLTRSYRDLPTDVFAEGAEQP